jgi:hypothetical protein
LVKMVKVIEEALVVLVFRSQLLDHQLHHQ